MPKTLELNINRPAIKYTIDIHEGNLMNLPKILKIKLGLKETLPKIFLITHLNLNTLYGQKLAKEFEKEGFPITVESVNSGESIKSWITAEKLLHRMIGLELDRSSVVIALGGGVIGDMAGFVSSVYQRGIRFVQVPTSLVAMVDSSVGGKVAVNLGLSGKNLIGAFHQPSFVLMDLSLLKSLPDAEWKNGLSEVLKCAFIRDDNGSFYNWLIENKAAILQKTDYAIISQLIYEAVKTKSTLVSKDEMETNGLRILLNLGHTFGHSLEAASRYRLAHGEAIAIGMTLAARLSLKLGKINISVFEQIMNMIREFGLTDHIEKKYSFTSTELIRHFKHDKKVETGQVRFILPVGNLGHSEIVQNVDEEKLKEVFSEATY